MESIEKFGPGPRRDLLPSSAPVLLPLSASESAFTWEQAVRVLRKNQKFVLTLAGTLILLTVALAFLMRNTYQPKALINVDPISSGIKTLHEIDDTPPVDNPDYIETQAQVLRGQGLAIGVIRALHLDRNPEFVSPSEIAKWGDAKAPALHASNAENENFLQDQFELANRTPLESMTLIKFQKKLSVSTIRGSRLIEVSFPSHDPVLAQAITNTLVTQFIEQNYRNRYTSTMEASVWLSKQIDDLRKKVEASNQAVADYQRKYGLVETDDKDVPLGQLMNEVNHQYSDAEASRIEMEAYVRMVNQGLADSIPAVRDDPFYQTLMGRFVDVRAQLAQARAIYGDENSNVKKLEDQLKEFNAQLDAERTRIIDRVQTSYAAARDREQMMLKAREKLRGQMGDASSRMVAYRVLKNEAIAEAELYNTLQGRLKEAGIYAGLRSSNIHVIDLAANLHKPTSPNRPAIIALGSILSCIFAVVLAFIRESMDNTVRTPDDMREWINKPALAMLPRIKPDSNSSENTATVKNTLTNGIHLPQIFLTRPKSAEAEAIRDLRAALLLSDPVSPPRVILVTSPSAGEGKTTVSVNLALALSQGGNTCLIEGDLRRPMAGQAVGIQSTTGLSQVFESNLPVNTAIVKLPDNPFLAVLPSGMPSPNPGDLISTKKMKQLLEELKQEYAFIVIDSPPLIPFSDARLMASVSDAVLLVGRYEVTTRRALTRCAAILEQVHAHVVGVVLNDIALESADYHYYNYGFSANRRKDPYYYNEIISPSDKFGPNNDGPGTNGTNGTAKKKAAGA